MTDTATLISTVLFSSDASAKEIAQATILQKTKDQGIYSATLFPIYQAIGNGTLGNTFTVPALNIRTLTFDTACMIFSLMKKKNIGPVIFEIARSELEYTAQTPLEFMLSIFAGALEAGHTGPVFLQADHLQVRKSHFDNAPEGEIADLKDLISRYLTAGFQNIDIDASTLVDYSLETPRLQQEKNAQITATLTTFLREQNKKSAPPAIGGEIGHIGDRNSTIVDFRAFMEQYLTLIKNTHGISKISVQTGSTHGGTPLSDGTIKPVTIDTQVLETIGNAARSEYFLGGTVQHGASTLPLESFTKLRQAKTLEVHLATGLQNIFFDTLSPKVKSEMYTWVKKECVKEEAWSEEQFFYKSRKKAFGPFKEQLYHLSPEEKEAILSAQEVYLTSIFENLNLFHTRKYLEQYYNE